MSPLRRTVLVLAAVAVMVAIEAVWLAPASLVDSRLARMTDGAVRLADADGTLWRARGIIIAGAARIPIAWRIEPWPILLGELRLHLTPGSGKTDGSPRADITFKRTGVSLRDVDLTFPASLIATATGRAAAEVVGGEVNVNATAIDWAPSGSRGEARASWHAARLIFVAGAAPLDLGDVRMTLTAEGDRLAGPVANDGGDLDIRGDITVREQDSIRLALLLAPRRSDNVQLARALALIGAADGGGWRVDWRLPLR